jgi:hypothetical protein
VKSHLDGAKLLAWMEHNYPWLYDRERDNTTQKHLREMSQGFAVDVYAVDRFLTKMGIPLTMVPEDFYVERNRRPSVEVSPADRRCAAERWAGGESTIEIAREYDVAPGTIRHWAGDLGLRRTDMPTKSAAPRVKSKCRTCGTEIILPKSKADTGRGKFCSRKCQRNQKTKS